MHPIPFQTIDWASVDPTEHKGARGDSLWQTLQMEGLSIRIVTYSIPKDIWQTIAWKGLCTPRSKVKQS